MAFEPLNSNVVFVKPVEDKYKCVSCGDVLKNPVQSLCGHRLCRTCVDRILQCPKPVCPNDGEQIQKDKIFNDRGVAREIAALECYCPQKASGCSWTGTVEALKEHQCPYEKVPCIVDGCDELLLRCQLPRHVEKECKYRGIQCLYCNLLIPEIFLEKHFDECNKYLLECENGCGERDIPRERMEEHKHMECPLEVKFCRFHHFGCDFRDTREQLEEHMKDAQQKHLILAVESAEKSYCRLQELEKKTLGLQETNRLLESYITSQKEALSTASETLSTQQIKLNKVEQFVQDQQKILDEMPARQLGKENSRDVQSINRNVLEFEKKIESFSQKLKSLQEDVLFQSMTSYPSDRKNPKFDQIEQMLTIHEIHLAEHSQRLQILNASSYDGTFLWKIENYSQQFTEAVGNKTPSLYSPPFYTSRFGYKLCARIYLNGDGTGKGTHMSLFISVMKGEYDAVLPWPFTRRITLKLLDQSKHIDVTETFLPDPNSSSFQKPKSQMNIASGCPKFCAHSRLQSNGYVRDNTVFIKVIVG